MLDWFANRWNDFIDFLWRLVLSVYDMLKDFFFWVIESLLDVAVFMLNGVGSIVGALDVAQYFSAIPPETSYILSLIGLSQALGMIVSCLTVRFIIQMIPFVRWGS